VSGAVHRSAVRVGVAVALILSLLFVAMQITDEVTWSLGDFVLAGALLATAGVALELAVKKAGMSPPQPASPSSASSRQCSARPMTHPAWCSWASCSSAARARSA
jgi:hypothetical protein